MQFGSCSSLLLFAILVLAQDAEGIPAPLTVHSLHLVLAGWVSSERAPSDGESQSRCSRAHKHQLQASCWVLAHSQGHLNARTLCSDRSICFLVFISFLTPSFCDILINLSPHQGFDLFICSYTLRQLRHFSGLWLSTSFRQAQEYFAIVSQQRVWMSHIHV